MSKKHSNHLKFSQVNDVALRVLPSLLKRWLPDGVRAGNEWIALNPTRADKKRGSFRINISTGRWADFATNDKGGDVISLAAYLTKTSQKEALYSLAKMLGVDL